MNKLKFRKAVEGDLELYYKWANEYQVRIQSFNSDLISLEDHTKWFNEKIKDHRFYFYLFQNEKDEYVGQVRIQITSNSESLIGVSVDESFRGLGLGSKLLLLATQEYFVQFPNTQISAYIKQENLPSKAIFEKAGFKYEGMVVYQNFSSYYFIKYANR